MDVIFIQTNVPLYPVQALGGLTEGSILNLTRRAGGVGHGYPETGYQLEFSQALKGHPACLHGILESSSSFSYPIRVFHLESCCSGTKTANVS